MERSSVNPSVLKWEKLNVHTYNYYKPIEIDERIGYSMSTSGSNGLFDNEIENADVSFQNYLFPASQQPAKASFGRMDSTNLPPYKSAYDDAMIGLRLGDNSFFPSSSAKFSMSASVPVLSTPAKRSRASYQNIQNPCCQVEGCNLDLKTAKDYHRRHRICESHSKSPKVVVAGMERRFCQQCSRFHDLSEFDDKKRSCRRRLSDHNARRRRVQPESIHLGSSAGLSSALYDQRQHNLLLNGLPISVSNSMWENGSTSILGHALIKPSKAGGLNGTPCFSSDEIHKSVFELHMDLDKLSTIQSSNPRVLDQCLQVPSNNSPIAPDLLNAHSLLSSNSWSLNEGETSSSIEGLVHGNYVPMMKHSHSEPQNLSLFHSFNIPLEQGPVISLVQSVNLPDEGTSHQQEYQLFKSSYDSDVSFCSTHRNV